jgi:hypothetical protein
VILTLNGLQEENTQWASQNTQWALNELVSDVSNLSRTYRTSLFGQTLNGHSVFRKPIGFEWDLSGWIETVPNE